MRIEVFQGNEQLDQRAADLITELVQASARPILGLATGSTPIGVYARLIEAYRSKKVSFKHAVSFNLDEYAGLPSDHSQSYAYFMKQQLFDHIDLPANQIHIPYGSHPDPQAECLRYDESLNAEDRIDIQILGLGHNGHIGFNEPGRSLVRSTHVVELSPVTREANARFFDSLDEVPRQAITMGIGSILHAKQILLLVKGAAKANIVKQALTGPITTEVPASLLQVHPNLLVMLDREAAQELDPAIIARS